VSPLVLKSDDEIRIMDEANAIVQRILEGIAAIVRPGVTTLEIDRYAEKQVLAAGAQPAFKGYPNPSGGRDFPGTVCTSVNSEVVHGVPSERVVLAEGDEISIDLGVLYRG
jgi:methionyl aminopeptidase